MSGSSTPSLRYSGMESSHNTDTHDDDDFFGSNLNSQDRLTPTSAATPPAKNARTTSSASVRARANSSTKKKSADADDEWSNW